MKWKSFNYAGALYDLSHVHPIEYVFVQPSKDHKPERPYLFDIAFGLHTFTRGIKKGEIPNNNLLYRDSREKRVFCFDRYELSKKLPGIVQFLGERHCYHTGHGNFFTVELTGSEGQTQHYEIYFEASRSSKKGRLNLFVQSAYVRDDIKSQPKTKKINFYVIAFKTQRREQIKEQK